MRLILAWLMLGCLTGSACAQSSYQLAEAAWNRALQSGKIKLSTHLASTTRVERIGARLALASRRQLPWHFYVVQGKDVNAFTVGEGFVAVTEGLLALGLDDNELAGVLAHEIAHGTEQHLMRDVNNNLQLEQAQREINEAAKLQARYQAELESSGNQATYDSQMATVRRRLSAAQKRLDFLQGQQRFAREFNHEQEIAADGVGIRYAVTAGYQAEGLQRALQRIQQSGVERFGQQYTGEGQTHPPLSRRLEVLLKVYQNWRAQGWQPQR